eukprot:CAMPEP_0197586058 /NCGR_PEP_ID=MMETSP1326-20131121/8165_1 /TAXON_ID=1155430 /ORGANISM="Genus nov. species nov., Strain RCC2288" /LENGTH=109 /DNA_ID=CAMNT_0043150647 /DNA_START=218 /DNA_END=544 /DNA_ORIENTATION=+
MAFAIGQSQMALVAAARGASPVARSRGAAPLTRSAAAAAAAPHPEGIACDSRHLGRETAFFHRRGASRLASSRRVVRMSADATESFLEGAEAEAEAAAEVVEGVVIEQE